VNVSFYIFLLIGAFLSGSVVGAGLVAILAVTRDWTVALLNSPYCAACGALAAGLYISKRMGKPSGQARIMGLAVGLAVGLFIPWLAWMIAPSLGFEPTEMRNMNMQAALGAGCGLVGASLYGRRPRRYLFHKNIERRRD